MANIKGTERSDTISRSLFLQGLSVRRQLGGQTRSQD